MREHLAEKEQHQTEELPPLNREKMEQLQSETRLAVYASLSSLSESIGEAIEALHALIDVGGNEAWDAFVAGLVPDLSAGGRLGGEELDNVKMLAMVTHVFPERAGNQFRVLMEYLKKERFLRPADLDAIGVVEACVIQVVRTMQDDSYSSGRGFPRRSGTLKHLREVRPIIQSETQKEDSRYIRREDAFENVKAGPKFHNTRSDKSKRALKKLRRSR